MAVPRFFHVASFSLGFALLLSACQSPETRTEIPSKGVEVDVHATELFGEGFSDFRWNLTVPQGSLTLLSNEDGEQTSFVPDTSGLYLVDLAATDGYITGTQRHTFELNDDRLSVTITIAETKVIQGAEVNASATAHDAKTAAVEYQWNVWITSPTDSVPFDTPDPRSVRFIASEAARYSIVVSAFDGLGNRGSSNVRVESMPQ